MASHRATLRVFLTPDVEAFLQGELKSGRYQTASEVVREALRLLKLREEEREQRSREVKSKLARGVAEAERGELLDGDEIFDELRDMIEERRRAKAVKP